MPRHVHTRAPFLVSAVLLGALVHPGSIRAEVRVTGAPGIVQVEARDASVEEVLAALSADVGLQYRSTASLDRRVTGTYQGSLQRVVRRLLEGYDYVLKTQAESIEVVVIGSAKPGEARPMVAPAPAVAAPATPAQPRAPKRRRHSG
jgi:hypothetical protein